jgi:hypothetical protein
MRQLQYFAGTTAIMLAAAIGIGSLAACGPVAARTLEVGPGKVYKMPSDAAAAAGNGDRIVIDAGQYFDCAVLRADNLTIEGSDPAGGAVLTDKTCQGKALLVTTGSNITVRNLTLTRARVPDGNGAGIRDESVSLTVDNVHFIDNQDGILTGAPVDATLIVRNSEFLRNGSCGNACAHGIYAGHIALLRVEHSKFFETREAHSIKSRALRTEVTDCDIRDGADGSSSYLIEAPNGGAVVVTGSTLEKGPLSQNHTTAIMIGSEGVTQPTPEITITGNEFRNDGGYATAFVDNITATPAQLKGNRVSGKVKPLVGDGMVR